MVHGAHPTGVATAGETVVFNLYVIPWTDEVRWTTGSSAVVFSEEFMAHGVHPTGCCSV